MGSTDCVGCSAMLGQAWPAKSNVCEHQHSGDAEWRKLEKVVPPPAPYNHIFLANFHSKE